PSRDALGLHIEEFAPVAPGGEVSLSDGTSGRLSSERSRATTAVVVATFVDGPSAGLPPLTPNTFGTGAA
ncbi:beta-galactosidase, partial [Microbacterium sp. C7(2022)]|nr:beta-galactosidase [Microbacterium sp. C7(2022)]